MKNNHKKYIVLSATLILAACGSGSSDSGSGQESVNESTIEQNNNDDNNGLNPAECEITNIVLTPSSGTISKSGTSLRGLIEFKAASDRNIRVYSTIESADGNDFILSDTVGASEFRDGRGQALISYNLNGSGGRYLANPDHYTLVEVHLDTQGNNSCRASKNVNFTLTN